MSYAEARELFKKQYNKNLRNSWIAHVRNDHGKTHGKSPTRKGDYKYPCPKDVRPKLEKLLKELKMI